MQNKLLNNVIIYKTTDWSEAFWHFHTGETAQLLLKRLAWIAVYVSIVTYLELTYLDPSAERYSGFVSVGDGYFTQFAPDFSGKYGV